MHLFNPARISFIKDKLISHFKLNSNDEKPLKGLKILDIGCGEGDLIQQLEKNLSAKVHGIEKNQELALKAIAKGLSVTHGDAEKDLSQYSNQSFDYVILSQTLQAMFEPKKILNELLRVGSKAIVSFPNFGHWKIRLQLLLKGKMPITEGLPYSWYDTPNIHFFTLKDFENLCNEMNIVSSTVVGQHFKSAYFELEINYLSEMFQEIQNKQDFGFESFGSYVGGFVGIFLGYSLSQVPEMAQQCIIRINTRLRNF